MLWLTNTGCRYCSPCHAYYCVCGEGGYVHVLAQQKQDRLALGMSSEVGVLVCVMLVVCSNSLVIVGGRHSRIGSSAGSRGE